MATPMWLQELIGWGSALVLLPTFGVQTYRQWTERHKHVGSTSLWFFVLAVTGTLGQFVYSWMVGNLVYLVLNGILVVNNSIGLGIAVHRARIPRTSASSDTDSGDDDDDEDDDSGAGVPPEDLHHRAVVNPSG
ncbi:MAG: hypothetical protein ACYC61_25765 [Isosphaeraceae bacterium]